MIGKRRAGHLLSGRRYDDGWSRKIYEALSAKKPMRRADEADWLFSDPMRHEGRQYITRGRVVDEHDVE